MVGRIRDDEWFSTGGREVYGAEPPMVAIALPGLRHRNPRRLCDGGKATGEWTQRNMSLAHIVQQQGPDRRLVPRPNRGDALGRVQAVALVRDSE